MKRNYTKDEIKKALESTGYYPDDKTVNAIWVSILGNRPVVIEGFPGCGKTELSHALAEGKCTKDLPQTKYCTILITPKCFWRLT